MIYGSLTVVCGPMFAGKTTELLRRTLWAKHLEQNVAVVKPSFDNRYSEEEIVSHDGLSTKALSIRNWKQVKNENYDLVCFDEVQFFEPPYFDDDVIEIIKELLSKGTEVFACGLDCDWQGNAFKVTGNLLAMADNIEKKTAFCSVCGREARKTFKKISSGGKVELGSEDLYEARCNEHWKY